MIMFRDLTTFTCLKKLLHTKRNNAINKAILLTERKVLSKKEIILSSIIATYTAQNADVNVGLKLTGLHQVI